MFSRCAGTGAAVIAVLLVGACDRPGAGRGVTSTGDAPNVLLITLDTTRADRLGCYGHAAAQTPALDALAETGVRFEQAFCQVPLTLPSHASLLTGTYPPSNGVRTNGSDVLVDDVPTLAEVFQAHGYRTGAFVGAWVLNSAFGLNRGFERYDDDVGGDEAAGFLYRERPADLVCAAALAWLGTQPERPFFAWVHFFDPHHPYTPPPAFQDQLVDPYDGEIAFVDSQVRRLLHSLEAKQWRARTLIVVVGDHGEAFDEHGETEHGLFLYEPTMRVPLIFSFPGRLPQGRVVSAGVRLIDVLPTILDLMGWEPTADLPGESLRPALETNRFAFLPAYGETEYPRVGFGWAPLRSYTTQRWKYIDAPRPELYDRRADPGELTNLIAQRPEVAAQLRGRLDALVAGMPKRAAESAALDDEAIRALQSLGYVAAPTLSEASEASDSDRPLRDPKDMVSVFRGFSRAQRMIQERRHTDVVQLLQPLVAQSPESDYFHAVLGEAYLELERFTEAEREYRLSLRTVATNPRQLCRLGDALSGLGRTAEAADCYQRAVSAAPDYGPAHNRLGMIRLRGRQFSQAREHFRRYLEIHPNSPRAQTNLAYALGQMGRHDEAVELLQKALQRRPKLARAHRCLWKVLLAGGRRDAAIDALRAARRALPDDHALTRHLAGLLATAPQSDPDTTREAILLATQCCDADPNIPENFDVLARAHAAAGDFANAVESARRAVSLAEQQGKTELAKQIATRLQAYQSGRTPGE